MDLHIGSAFDATVSPAAAAQTLDGGLFQNELVSALGKQMVVISPKIEAKMKNDPEYSEELSQKLNELLQSQGKSMRDSIVIVNKNGEITQYCTRPKREKHPTAEELKEVAKARARRKARLDAYFHRLERSAIKRKLIEQENAKRLINKKYRRSVSALDIEARARQITAPPMNPNYFM